MRKKEREMEGKRIKVLLEATSVNDTIDEKN